MKATPTLRLRRVIDETGTPDDHVLALRAATGSSVSTVMSRTTYCLRPEVSVRSAVAMLLEHRMSGAPVVDANGHPIGIVSKTDLLRHLHERSDAIEPGSDDRAIDAGFHATDVDGTTVGEVMMPVVFAIEESTTIAAASALMAGEGVHRLPVLDRQGAVIGILSTLDVVRWVAERAGYHV